VAPGTALLLDWTRIMKATGARAGFGVCLALACAWTSPGADALRAQTPDDGGGSLGLPVSILVRVARGSPTMVPECSFGTFWLPGLEIRTRGRVFVSAGAERVEPTGSAAGCELLPASVELPDGRTVVRSNDLVDFDDGGSHYAVGIGLRIPPEFLAGEAALKLGAARGQQGFRSSWMRAVTASVGVAAFRGRVLISLERRWFRTPYWERTYAVAEPDGWFGPSLARPAGAETRWSWREFNGVVVGFRL
jgi:hypothetical protein